MRAKLLGVAFGLIALAVPGCMTHSHHQYYSVRDEDTGATSYYRLTVRGQSGVGQNYRMQCGYFSNVAVDILRGQMPSVPELDLPIERVRFYDQLINQIDMSLYERSKQLLPAGSSEARLIAARSDVDRAEERLEKAIRQLEEQKTAVQKAERSLTEAQKLAEEKKGHLANMTTTEAAARKAREEAQKTLTQAATLATEAKAASDKADALALTDPTEANKTKAKELKEALTKAETAALAAQKVVEEKGLLLEAATQKVRTAQIEADGADASVIAHTRDKTTAEKLIPVHTGRVTFLEGEVRAEQKRVQDLRELTAEAGSPAPLDGSSGATVARASPSAAMLPRDEFESRFIEAARLVWFNTLTGADLAAIGESQSTDPYRFRKLVFWSTSQTLNLREVAVDVDAIADNVVQIGRSYKTIGAERTKAAEEAIRKEKARAKAALDAIKEMGLPTAEEAKLKLMIKILNPELFDAEGEVAK